MGVDVGLGHIVDRWRAAPVLLTLVGGWMGWSAHCGCRCGFRPFSRQVESAASLADIDGWVDGSVRSQWLLVLDHQGDRGGEETLLTNMGEWMGGWECA